MGLELATPDREAQVLTIRPSVHTSDSTSYNTSTCIRRKCNLPENHFEPERFDVLPGGYSPADVAQSLHDGGERIALCLCSGLLLQGIITKLIEECDDLVLCTSE